MKLAIREAEPKEDPEIEIELWLEQQPNGNVNVMSKRSDDPHNYFEAKFYPDGTKCILLTGNFKIPN